MTSKDRGLRSAGIPAAVAVIVLAVAIPATRAQEKVTVPNAVHKPFTLSSHRTLKEVNELEEIKNKKLTLRPFVLKATLKDGHYSYAIDPTTAIDPGNAVYADYVIIGQHPPKDTSVDAEADLDVIIVDDDMISAHPMFAPVFVVLFGAVVLGVGFGLGYVIARRRAPTV
jgi:hypothetical protein